MACYILDRRYIQLSVKKRVKLGKKAMYILVNFPRFLIHSIENISGLHGWILMQDIVLETLLVVLYMIEVSKSKFINEIWLRGPIGTYITFLKGYDAGFPKKLQIFNKFLH